LALSTALTLVACARGGAPATQTPDATAAERPAVGALPQSVDSEALESTASTLQSKVRKVTVFSDRARVTRQARATIGPAPTVLAFRKLPGWVDDGSVRVSTDAGRIVDVRVERSFLAQATDETYQAAADAHQALLEKMAALDDEIAVLAAQKLQIESIKAFSLEKITQDTTIGDVSVDAYDDVLGFITKSLRGTAAARRKVQSDRTELQPELDASQRKLADIQDLMKLEETTVLVTLQGAGGASEATIDVTYMLPGATWEPVHELRVSGTQANAVEVVSFAQVTQTSGEDWGQAELAFSTQSSTQSVRIPELEALTLGDTHTADRILTSKISSFTRAQQAFEGQNELWNRVHHRSNSVSERTSFEQVYKSNVEYLQVVQGKTVQIFESLQKRGTTAQFLAKAAPAVRGDGHPVRMRIGSATLSADEAIVAVPEQSLNAARTLQLKNSTGQSLLPGKVALYRDGTFLGMTEMDFVAEGESFSLFLGVADHLKIARKLDRKRSSLIRKRRNRMEVAFIVTVENLSSEAASFELADRIPVSENRDIKVDRVRIAPAVAPDSRGLLSWDVKLQPQEKREYRISYVVDYPSELVIEARRRRAAEPSASPRSPVKRKRYRIDEQLADLEDSL
jgi:uncharacterized protein (TIGR02231 family)